MTNEEQKLREIVERWMGKKHPITMQSYVSDLTALISEHYYPKEKYDELLQQRDELKEENEKLKRQIQSYNPYPNRPNPRDVNPYDIGSVKRARRGR